MIQHETELWDAGYNPYVNKISVIYKQYPDNYANTEEDNSLCISTEPGGYFIIQTNRWAFDSIEELIKILEDFKNKVEFGKD